jgi:predicted O-methyltransferase YrrM
MNAILGRILDTQTVTDGVVRLPLRHPDFPALPVHVDAQEGQLLAEIIRGVDPTTTLEIGMAYAVSTLYICEALAALAHPVRHIVIDPYQSSQWRSIGLRNVREAGYESFVDFREERSEFALPQLVEQGRTIDFAFVDGWHTFDQVMVEFFYLDRLLHPGGVIAFDDADRRSVNRVIRYAITFPNYEPVVACTNGGRSLLGAARRALRKVPAAERVFRRDLLYRDWDLGILGSCIVLRKTAETARSSGWYRDF